jgi:hypothetical protein
MLGAVAHMLLACQLLLCFPKTPHIARHSPRHLLLDITIVLLCSHMMLGLSAHLVLVDFPLRVKGVGADDFC